MVLNIIKGVGALFLVFVICFVANVILATAAGNPTQPNVGVAFAWIGTVGAMFYSGTGFWRRLAASLLGSIASLVVPLGFAALNAFLLQNEMYTYSPQAMLGIGAYLAIYSLAQLAIAYFVARWIVRRGLPRAASSSLAVA